MRQEMKNSVMQELQNDGMMEGAMQEPQSGAMRELENDGVKA